MESKNNIQTMIDNEIKKLLLVGWDNEEPLQSETKMRKLLIELVGEVHVGCPESMEKYQAVKCLKDASVWIRAAARKRKSFNES